MARPWVSISRLVRFSEHGHSHHMRSINRINGCGSIQAAVETGILKEGLMYEVIKARIPYCLAGIDSGRWSASGDGEWIW